ncbi:MAG: hypothetical protein M3539_18510 [Acidobacteriota bacterium]|nr:hypothetical protein [Acidobacteriota bacterium]
MSESKSSVNSDRSISNPFLPRVSSNTTRTTLRILGALLLAVVFLNATAIAQTTSASPESEEIIRLREQKTRAELEKDIAVAEKAKLDAQFPKPSTSPLSGETKVEGATIESDMVSYVSMAHAANKVVKALKDSNLNIGSLAIYSKPDIDLLLNYNVTTSQLEIARKQYCQLLKRDPRCADLLELDLALDRFKAGKRLSESGESGEKSREESARAGVRSFIGPLPIISSVLGAFVDMTALLRTNVSVQGHAVEINESALVSEIFRAIRSQDGLGSRPELFYPAAFSPSVDLNTSSEILGKIQVLFELKARTTALLQGLEDNLKKTKKTGAKIEEVEVAIKEIKLEQKRRQDELNSLVQTQRVYGRRTPFEAHQRVQELRKLLADLSQGLYHAHKDLDAKKADLKSLEAKQASLLSQLASDLQTADPEETVTKLKMLNERFDQFVANLVKVDGATGINSLTAYIRAENLNRALNNSDGDGYWLQLGVVKAGGNNRIKSNLVTDIFTGGSRISHSGGVIVQYNLYDQNGKSLVSDMLTEYGGYVKAGKIKQLKNPAALENRQDNQAKRKTGPRETRVAINQF